MWIKVHRVYDEAHAEMEAGKSITTMKFHRVTGHTGEHLLKNLQQKLYETQAARKNSTL